jgi:hypothetical protein
VIYVLEDSGRNIVKIGMASSVEKRKNNLGTGNLGLVELVHFPGERARERELHKRFAADRVEATREFFYKSAAVRAFIDDMVREHGKSLPEERGESARRWLRRVRRDGIDKRVRDAADQDLKTWERLMEQVPSSARGGWSLWEWLGGQKSTKDPGLFAACGEPAVAAFTYRGEAYSFHVYQEACKRYGMKRKDYPLGSLKTGIQPRSHKVPTHRKLTKRATAEVVIASDEQDTEQTSLFEESA